MARRPVRVVVFDIGETLLDERRPWRGWAEYLGVSEAAFHAALHQSIVAGEHHLRAFERLKPGFDLLAARKERKAEGTAVALAASDLYADATPCVRLLQQRGFRVGLAANQPPGRSEEFARLLGIEPDFVGSSAEWGVEKPAPEFFARVVAAAAVPPARIAYVGDRVDNDVLPARAAGMVAVFLVRGPWGRVHAKRPDSGQAHISIESLAELPDAIARYNRGD